jgi:raffinose/stachyose/melibiose transport system substrate-binding protein
MRRIRVGFWLFGLLLLLAPLAWAGGTKEGTTSGAGKSAIQGSIRVWGDTQNETITSKPFQEINAAFMKEYPNVKVTYDFGENNETLQVAIQSDSLPDAFYLGGNKNPQTAELARAGRLLDLTGKIDNMSMYTDQNIIDYITVDGKVILSPTGFLDSQLVYYNKDIFQKQGLSVPKTWNDFLALNDKLLANRIQPIAIPGAAVWDNSWAAFAFFADFASDALLKIYHGKGTWNDPAIVKAFDYTRLLAEKGYYGKDYTGMNQQDAQLAFTSGKAAMYVDGTWEESVYGGSGLNLGRFYIPNEQGVRIGSLSVSNYMTYAVSSKTKYPDAAVAYVNYLAQLPAQQIMENDAFLPFMIKGIKPANDVVNELSAFDRLGAQMHQVATACDTDKSKPDDLLMNTIIPQLIQLKITGKEAADLMDKASTYPKPTN